MTTSKEKVLFVVFNGIAALGFGLAMTGWLNPILGVLIMAAAVLYWLYEILSFEALTKRLSLRWRLIFGGLVVISLASLLGPPTIRKLRSKEEKPVTKEDLKELLNPESKKEPLSAETHSIEPKREPPPETLSNVPSIKLRSKVKSLENPLELVDFNSEQHISIANNGSVSVFVMDLLMKLKDPYVSRGHRLDIEIEPGKIASLPYTDDTAFQHWGATHALADTWHEHYAKSIELYNSCGLGLVFFSPSDPGFQQIKNHYSGQARSLIFSDAEALVHYRLSGRAETKEQTLAMVAITAVNRDGCPPGY